MKKHAWLLKALLPLLLVGCSNANAGFSSDLSDSSGNSPLSSTSDTSNEGSSSAQSASSSPMSSSSASPSSSSNSEESSSSQAPVHVKSVSLDQTSIVFYQDDPSVTLTATVLPEDADNKEVTWSSSDTSVATVGNGLVTPVNPGNATITVKTVDGNKTATCKVSVSFPNYVIHGKFKDQSDWMDVPMTYNEHSTSEYMLLGIQLYKDDVFSVHMYGDVWYGASDLKSSIASGLVTRASTNNDIKVLTSGVYDIYSSYNSSDGGHIYLAKTGDTPAPGTIHVTDVLLNRSGKYLQFRTEYQLVANVYPSTASNKEVVWTSSDESIATVSRSGRVIAKDRTGTAVITAMTVDQGKVDTCLVYVTSYETPEYFLTGTVGGRSYSYGTYTYAALPLGSGQYFIPNVDLVKGDEIYVMGRNGARLRDNDAIGNPVYTYYAEESKAVNMYLDTRKTSDYLSAVNRASRDIYVKYDADTNDNNECAWIYVSGSDITPEWTKSTSLMKGSTGSRFNIPRHATSITFARANRNQTPDNFYSSLEGKTRVKMFDIVDGVYEYDATVDSD